MLLRRVLNEAGSQVDAPYGTKVFAFLENLDLVNRLYRQLLNAEGRNPFGQPRPELDVLAGLRIPSYAEGRVTIGDMAEWDENGQYWWLPERLGFGAGRSPSRVRRPRTVGSIGSRLVVATSSLRRSVMTIRRSELSCNTRHRGRSPSSCSDGAVPDESSANGPGPS